jgi:hypothetical protein
MHDTHRRQEVRSHKQKNMSMLPRKTVSAMAIGGRGLAPSSAVNSKSAWATRSEIWRSRVERASIRRTKRAKPQSALILAGYGVSLRIHGGALEIKKGLTHYPQQRETYLFFRGDVDLPERIIPFGR